MNKYTVHALAGSASVPEQQRMIAPGQPPTARGGVAVRLLHGREPLTVGPSLEELAYVVLEGTVTVGAGPIGAGQVSAAQVSAGQGGAEGYLSTGAVVFVPPGTRRWLVAGGDAPVLLLAISGLPGDAAERAAYQVGTTTGGDGSRLLHATGGFSGMGVRWLATSASAGCRDLAVATSTFPPGGNHDLHRHPHADEFFLVIDGGGEHLTESGPVRLGLGDLAYIPAGEWHGYRTAPGVTTRAVYGYLGASSLDEAGYHLCESSPGISRESDTPYLSAKPAGIGWSDRVLGG